ncbi:hypothetical protein [Saccharicrinis fermentans]|uniref:hypothetical protein n=1 Tax=Saccharicrinis fermentans TaxID=982 RepID=UPI0021CF21A6|nr:hypothetical protein [Saccharicrinis fermentans]
MTLYVMGELSFEQMFERLNIAIHQFAKRQMTWFRKMERNGFQIHWVDANDSIEDRLSKIKELLQG